MAIVVRVRSPNGMVRVTLPSSGFTVGVFVQELLKALEEAKIKLTERTVLLSRNPNGADPISLNSKSSPFSSLRLQHGDMVFLQTQSVSTAEKSDAEVEGLRSTSLKWTMEEYVNLMNERQWTVEPQESSTCKGVFVDMRAASIFQNFSQQVGFQQQRLGYLFGRIDEEGGYVWVDAIYEPPQSGFDDRVDEEDQPDQLAQCEFLCQSTGLQQVGWIMAHTLHTSKKDWHLSAGEALRAARIQSQCSKFAVTLLVRPTPSEDPDADADASAASFEAFQVSDSFVERYAANQSPDAKPWERLFDEGHPNIRDEPGHLRTLRPIKIDKKEQKHIDTDMLLTTVPIQSFSSPFRTSFPPLNRPFHVPTMNDVKNALRTALGGATRLTSSNAQKFVTAFSDFHLLLFLSGLPVWSDLVPDLCGIVVGGVDAVNQLPDGTSMMLEGLIASL